MDNNINHNKKVTDIDSCRANTYIMINPDTSYSAKAATQDLSS